MRRSIRCGHGGGVYSPSPRGSTVTRTSPLSFAFDSLRPALCIASSGSWSAPTPHSKHRRFHVSITEVRSQSTGSVAVVVDGTFCYRRATRQRCRFRRVPFRRGRTPSGYAHAYPPATCSRFRPVRKRAWPVQSSRCRGRLCVGHSPNTPAPKFGWKHGFPSTGGQPSKSCGSKAGKQKRNGAPETI